MSNSELLGGTIHAMPADLRKALTADATAHKAWDDITPLARNEWICWVEQAKHIETRQRRVVVGISKLNSGMRRPCCWSGCPHRERNGK